MSAKRSAAKKLPAQKTAKPAAFVHFIRNILPVATGWLCLLVSVSFFTATYDTAQVKLTLLHAGSTVLLALWTALKLAERKSPFTRGNLPFLLPFFVYIGWNVLSFAFLPYKLEAAEEFIRLLMYGGITLLVACEFRPQDVRTLTKFIIAAAWVSFAYAALQIADGFFPGADFMPWRGFFTRRVFSTHANPNFFGAFVIFASCVAGAQYLLTRKKSLLVLLGLGLAGLFFTESKGAWLAYAAALACFAGLYTNFLAPEGARKHLKKINLAAGGFLLIALVLAGVYASKRFQSVSFRAYTWLSAVEMAQDAPVMGTGPGSFKIIYPAYRRPQIFYIENSHNTETQHAENEYLEQWATTGTVGLAVFLWMILFVLVCAARNLKRGAETAAETPALKERNWYLLGYASAFFGLLAHGFVDISLRFASSGLFFALFGGVIIALCKSPGEPETPQTETAAAPAWLAGGARVLLLGALLYAGWRVLAQFSEVTSALVAATFGEGALIVCSWAVLLFCVLGVIYVYMRAAFLSRTAIVSFVLLASVPLLCFFYGFFQANHYYSLGVSLTGKNNPEGAIGYFTKAIKLNPFQTEYRQFRANVFATTMNLTKTFSPARGDKDTPSDDYERALNDFAAVLKRAPNHSLLHQNIGQLYYAMAVRQAQGSAHAPSAAEYELFSQNARDNMAQAKRAFERSLKVDPVNESTYLFLISIALMERNPDRAQYWIDAYRRGPEGVTESEFLEKHRLNPRFDTAQRQVEQLRSAVLKNAAKK